MRPTVKLLLATLLITSIAGLGSVAGCNREPALPKRVLVFGIDGGTWDVILDEFKAGQLPNLKRIYDSGVHGVLESRPPILSPVVWSTIFTGRPWQEHGVKDWKTSQSQHRQVKPIWQIASQLGLQSNVVNVPSTWPPEQIRGEMISGFPLSGSTIGGNTGEVVTHDGLSRPDLPPSYQYNTQRIQERLNGLAVGAWSDWFPVEVRGRPNWRAMMRVLRFEDDRYYLTPIYRTDDGVVITQPIALHAELDKQIGQPYVPEGPGWSKHAEEDTPKYLYDHLLQIAQVQTKGAALLAAKKWDLFIYVDTLVDRISHPYWSYMRPNDYVDVDPAKAARYGDVVRNAYRQADLQLGEVLKAAEAPYWVMIVSDHGFQSSQEKTMRIGTHAFDGIYIVSGPGLKSSDGARAYIEDVAPTVLYLLDKPVGSDMKGKVIQQVADAVGRTIQTVPTYEDGVHRGTNAPVDAKTWEQLRGLGYVDGAAPKKVPPPPPVKPKAPTGARPGPGQMGAAPKPAPGAAAPNATTQPPRAVQPDGAKPSPVPAPPPADMR